MNAKVFGQFIAQTRKEKTMTQTQLAEKIGVTDKAVSRWERGIGFPDINTLEPLANALGVTIPELMRSEKSEFPRIPIKESEVIEMMNKAVEMSTKFQKQDQFARHLGFGITILIAILFKLFTNSNILGAAFAGAVVSLTAITLYYHIKNYDDRMSRRIYGSFLLAETLIWILLFHLSGIGPGIAQWWVFGLFALSIVLTY